MNTRFLLLIFLLLGPALKGQTNQQIENIVSFAKVYGFVKYFHPSDEAAQMDWVHFASYGASRVINCENRTELVQELENLFNPIAPSIKFVPSKQQEYDLSFLKPKDTSQYRLAFWQHLGVDFGMNPGYASPYASARVNGKIYKEPPRNHGLLVLYKNITEYSGKKMRFRGKAKLKDSVDTEAYLRLALVHKDGTVSLQKETIASKNWNSYEIEVEIDSEDKLIEVGAALKGGGHVLLDDVELSYWDTGSWTNIPIANASFENGGISESPEEMTWFHRGEGYIARVTDIDAFEGNRSGELSPNIKSDSFGERIFDEEPRFGEVVQEDIGNAIICQIPIVLYSNEEGTYPKADKEQLRQLTENMNAMPYEGHEYNRATMLAVRLGNMIDVYNVFQHFYPYMDVVEVDWEKEFKTTLRQSFVDESSNDHYISLEKFTSPLNDGHINVNFKGNMNTFAPRITWDWIEDKLVITRVLDNELPLKKGDIVTHVDGKSSKEYFEEIYARISAGTKGYLDYRAKSKSLFGGYQQNMVIRVNEKDVELDRTNAPFNEGPRESSYEKINDDVYYLNISRIEMDTITQLLPQLAKTKSIICDLRGYPNRNHGFLSYLLKENDTSSAWMQVPKMIYPDQKNIVGYEKFGWSLRAEKPYLGDKQIIFLTDGRAISYAESYMGFVEAYDLATIIGQPTAGTNGNVNFFDLDGGFRIGWTGMKVLKHDGSQHHGIGILPDIFVSKTIKALKEGRDETLEKALELTKQE